MLAYSRRRGAFVLSSFAASRSLLWQRSSFAALLVLTGPSLFPGFNPVWPDFYPKLPVRSIGSVLALSLLVLGIFADNHNFALALNNFALFTHGLDGRSDFHFCLLARYM